MHDVRLFGSKLTNFSQIPKIFRKPSPPLANLSGELIEDVPIKNVQPPIGTGRPGGNKKRRPQDSWPGYLDRQRKIVPETKKNRGKEKRMRGGGSNTMFKGDSDFTWYNSKFMAPTHRLEGGGCGGCGESNGCAKPPMRFSNLPPLNNDFLTLSPQYLSGNKCKLRHEEGCEKSCLCPPKDCLEATLKSKGQGSVCTKKSCVGGDCLIKAFKDAQEFVDGLGKVPGLAGLGIVSGPYFNGPRTSTMNQQRECRKGDSRSTVTTMKPPESCGPCGKYDRPECQEQPPPSSLEAVKKPSISVPAPAPVNAGPRKSAVQEGAVALPDPATQASIKAKKKDDKNDKQKEPENGQSVPQENNESPCGDPKCRSRPVKKKEKECVGEDDDQPRKNSILQKSKYKNSKSAPGLKTKRIQYVYNFGDEYPIYGHKHCAADRSRVPAKQGWSWDKVDKFIVANKWYKPRPGWRPGAISVAIRDQLIEAKEGFFTEKRPKSAPSKGKKGHMIVRKGRDQKVEEEEDEDIEYPPTLHIHRKNGDYYVTMYPIRPETEDLQRLDAPINPLQFKIVKSKTSVASSSTASDMEIEFSPPAAVNRLKKKPNVVHTGTQLKQQMIHDEYKKLHGPKKKNSKDGKKDKKKPA